MTTTEEYRVDTDTRTVIRTNQHGEEFDLNAHGEPCEDLGDLRELVRELRQQGAYTAETEAELLDEV